MDRSLTPSEFITVSHRHLSLALSKAFLTGNIYDEEPAWEGRTELGYVAETVRFGNVILWIYTRRTAKITWVARRFV